MSSQSEVSAGALIAGLPFPPFLLTASFPQQKILENELPFPRGEWGAADPAGRLSISCFRTCVDFDFLIKSVAGWALK
jgi:hypothetical protein